jgi:hypothetical protein
MKRLDRSCKVCGHPKRNHCARSSQLFVHGLGRCNNCGTLEMYHNFKLDNLKYLEEKSEKTL